MPSTHTHTHKAESLHLHNSTSSLTCFSKLWQRGKMMILQMCMRRLTFVIVCDRECSCWQKCTGFFLKLSFYTYTDTLQMLCMADGGSSAHWTCSWTWPPWQWCCQDNHGRRTAGRCSWRQSEVRPIVPWWSGPPPRCWRCPTGRQTPGSWTLAAACSGRRTWCQDQKWPHSGSSEGNRPGNGTWPRCPGLARSRWSWWSHLRRKAEEERLKMTEKNSSSELKENQKWRWE